MKFYENWLIEILKIGTVPRHIAFIMDGNRRYAESQGEERCKGHELGFESLKNCLEWCKELGVKIISLYAFSVDNLERDKDEVDFLMNLARDKLKAVSEETGFLQRFDVAVKVHGNLDLVPKDVKETMELVMERTKNNKTLELNLCFCYDSTYEIDKAILLYQQEKQNLDNKNTNIEEKILSKEIWKKYMCIRDEPDVVCSASIVCFLEEKWPELSLLSLLKIIMKYQLQKKYLEQLKKGLDNYEREKAVV